MELDKFIQKSIESIIDGIQAAKKNKGADVVNPSSIMSVHSKESNSYGVKIHG
jgi:hypothetical protein